MDINFKTFAIHRICNDEFSNLIFQVLVICSYEILMSLKECKNLFFKFKFILILLIIFNQNLLSNLFTFPAIFSFSLNELNYFTFYSLILVLETFTPGAPSISLKSLLIGYWISSSDVIQMQCWSGLLFYGSIWLNSDTEFWMRFGSGSESCYYLWSNVSKLVSPNRDSYFVEIIQGQKTIRY